MFLFEENADLVQDKEDLIALLKLRFGELSSGVIEAIYNLDKLDTVERLILVAANAQKLSIFLEELEEGSGQFKLMGERFNPIESQNEEGGIH